MLSDEELKAFDQTRLGTMGFGQRRYLHGIIEHKGRFPEMGLYFQIENSVKDFMLRRPGVKRDAQRLGGGLQFPGLTGFDDVLIRVFLEEFEKDRTRKHPFRRK